MLFSEKMKAMLFNLHERDTHESDALLEWRCLSWTSEPWKQISQTAYKEFILKLYPSYLSDSESEWDTKARKA